LALVGAGFVIFLVVTGMVLNHADSLGLDQRDIKQPEILAWYGLRVPKPMQSVQLGGQSLTWAGSRLYLDDQEVTSTVGLAVGAVANGEMIVAASEKELILLTQSGDLVERLSPPELGTGVIDSLGQTDSGLVVIGSGQAAWQSDQDLLVWSPLSQDLTAVKWSALAATDEARQKQISQHYLGPGLSWEKLILDLHSGRLFGPYGVWVFDVLALILLTLAVSGLILWQRGRGNGKSNGRGKAK
jgi:hypothetical protein